MSLDSLSPTEIEAQRRYWQKEKTEKNTPISVVALAILKDLEKGTVSLPEQEEIDAMCRFWMQDKSPFAKDALLIVDGIEKTIQQARGIKQE